MTYHPPSGLIVAPLSQTCLENAAREVALVQGGGGVGASRKFFEMPGTNGNLGKVGAYHADTLEEIWNHQQRASLHTGTISTGGDLVFVDILRQFKVNQQLCATEKRHIVYTDSKPKTGQTDEAEIPGEWTEKINTNAVQLFRYSALTFNGHRIHYDRKYATEVEGYPGLVVHGPLLATILSLFAERNSGRQLRKYSFRGKRPIFDLDGFILTGSFSGKNSAELRVLDHMSQLSMTADAFFL